MADTTKFPLNETNQAKRPNAFHLTPDNISSRTSDHIIY